MAEFKTEKQLLSGTDFEVRIALGNVAQDGSAGHCYDERV